MKTEFHDKSGKELYTGDIIVWRLGTFGKKSGGPTNFELIKTKKGIKLVDQNDQGYLMRNSYEQYISLLDTKYRELD